MQVELLNHTPLNIAISAIRTCWDTNDKSDNGGKKDMALVDRVANKYKHESTIEHLVYTFDINGVSRALLQELARHRIASLSVKSTRYTLKELNKEEPFYEFMPNRESHIRATKYLVMTSSPQVNQMAIKALENLRLLIRSGTSNDLAKYAMPEAYRTELKWTINARSLRNFLKLRSSKEALWEIRELAKAIYSKIPEDHMIIFEGYVE